MKLEDLRELLAKALESTGFLVVVASEALESQVTLLCRLASGMEDRWAGVNGLVQYLLRQPNNEISLHICKQYLLQGDTPESAHLVFGHCLSVRSTPEDLEAAVRKTAAWIAHFLVADGSRPQDRLVTRTTSTAYTAGREGGREVPLPGRSGDRNVPTGGLYGGVALGGATPIRG